MRVLWLSPNSGIYNKTISGYGTGGWVGALQSALLEHTESFDMALAFPSAKGNNVDERDGFKYYGIQQPKHSAIDKLLHYYGLKDGRHNYESQIISVINDFNPDVIHIFGMENPFISSVSNVDIPIVIHLQGLLAPIANAFFPAGFSEASPFYPFSKRESLLRNGIGYSYKNLQKSVATEFDTFKRFHNFMGRTHFDEKISSILSPESCYYKVNEVMRPVFYQNAGTWSKSQCKFVIFSTLSEATYKGLDVILKTADVLKRTTDIEFEWQIAGISPNNHFVKLIEHHYQLSSKDCNVSYLGILSGDKLMQHMLSASLFVHPSYIDNSPNSVCEAQMLGMPVIACNVGGVSTILDDGNSGILVPSNAPYEMAYYIRKIYTDPKYAVSLGLTASEYAKMRHDKKTIVEDLFKAYRDIIQKSKL